MLVATHDQQLHVLNNTEIKWAAHMDMTPVSIGVATFGGTRMYLFLLESSMIS